MDGLTGSRRFSAKPSLGQRRNKERASTRPEARRLRLEPLEERSLLATFSVMNANDAGVGSFHQAILDANAAPGADTVTFAPALAGATISTINISITDDVDIQGPLGGPVVLSGDSSVFRAFVGAGRILDIAAGADVSISRLTLTNGDAFNPDPFVPTGQAFGGAIRNAGTLTVRQCLFYHNGASEPNEGVGAGGGGAIYNSGTLTVIGSSFAANFADWGSGGAIYNDGTATVTNSTFIDNYVGARGGAIFNNTLRTMTVENCTIVKSGGDPSSGVLGLPTGSDGITNWGTMTLNNTIVADTPVGGDVENTSVIAGSGNLIKDGSGGLPGTITGDPMLTPPDYTGSPSFPALALLPRPGLKGVHLRSHHSRAAPPSTPATRASSAPRSTSAARRASTTASWTSARSRSESRRSRSSSPRLPTSVTIRLTPRSAPVRRSAKRFS